MGTREVARGEGNTIPAMLDAVRAEATLGEVCGALRDLWGSAPRGGGSRAGEVLRGGEGRRATVPASYGMTSLTRSGHAAVIRSR